MNSHTAIKLLSSQFEPKSKNHISVLPLHSAIHNSKKFLAIYYILTLGNVINNMTNPFAASKSCQICCKLIVLPPFAEKHALRVTSHRLGCSDFCVSQIFLCLLLLLVSAVKNLLDSNK